MENKVFQHQQTIAQVRQNEDTSNSNDILINSESTNSESRRYRSLSRLISWCSPTSSCFLCLVIGLLTGGLILSVVISLWLTLNNKTATTIEGISTNTTITTNSVSTTSTSTIGTTSSSSSTSTTSTTTPSFCAATCTGTFNSNGATSCNTMCNDKNGNHYTCSSNSTICPNAESSYYYYGIIPTNITNSTNVMGYNSYCNSAFAGSYLNNGYNPCYGGTNSYYNGSHYSELIPSNACCVYDVYLRDYYCIQYPCVVSG
ncbi:unnamed protein product [Adineta ricciae]|uniref:Uncharacterized protein n=1 Tax=Adineta ricciae TaxID=249248 RepID=A0A815T3I7_ADIRI|nr:unnamed protein product [Adineta ricciae]